MPDQRPSLTRSLLRSFRKLTHLLARALPLTLIAVLLASSGLAATTIISVDSMGSVGKYTSLALDGSGFPVVSYWDANNSDLKLVHCNDPRCVGGDEDIATVDSSGFGGQYTSLALDGSGFPVISYFDQTNGGVGLAHCNDPNCAGGNESLATVDGVGTVGWHTSLALDSFGFPVVSYYDSTNDDLKLVHCDDANCVGGGESIVTVDSVGNVGAHTSLALDSSGYPVVSYYDETNRDLKLAHCNDPNCAGGGDSLVTVDSSSNVGWYTSLALDSSGFPVVSYYDLVSVDLKLVHCNDPNCAGGDENIVAVDSSGFVGLYTSLELDGSGFPVVSYYDFTNFDLKLAHCNDANCNGHSIATVDSAFDVGQYTSLALDSSGFPVISYYDATNENLKLAHCSDANCAPDTSIYLPIIMKD